MWNDSLTLAEPSLAWEIRIYKHKQSGTGLQKCLNRVDTYVTRKHVAE